MISDNKNILHSRGLVELHVHLDVCEIHVHKLQGCVCSDGTQQSFRKGHLESTAMLTPPDHSFTILDQRWPPESLLGESQCSSLTLMSSIPMNTVQSNTFSASPLGVTFKYSRPLSRIRPFHTLKSTHPLPSMCHPSNSRSKVSLFGDGISLHVLSHFLHVASMGSESCDSAQSTTCIAASFMA